MGSNASTRSLVIASSREEEMRRRSRAVSNCVNRTYIANFDMNCASDTIGFLQIDEQIRKKLWRYLRIIYPRVNPASYTCASHA